METLEMDTPYTGTAIARRDTMAVSTPMSVQELIGQVTLVQEVMKGVMKEGEHYGKIPGCGDKPALLKAGAEKLGMTFRLAPTFDIRRLDMNGGHREYEVVCTLNGRYQGVGACSTMEGKYRYRTGPKKSTDKPVPKQYWDIRQSDPAKAQALLGGKGFSTMKDGNGQWVICEQGEKVEHDNPADHYNTVLKMAKKRAHVDAVLTATAASDCFVQDLEELVENGVVEPEAPKSTTTRSKSPSKTTGAAKPFKSKDQLIKLLGANADAAIAVLRKQGILTSTEGLEAWPEDALPNSPEQLNALLADIQDYSDANQGGDPGPNDEPQGDEPTGWRELKVPFGKDEGKLFGDLTKNQLWWWCVKWEVRPFNGKVNPKDTALRAKLDEVREHYQFEHEEHQ